VFLHISALLVGKPLEEEVVVCFNNMKCSELVNLWVSDVFLYKEIPNGGPLFECVAMLNGHDEEFVYHLHDIQSILLRDFCVRGWVVLLVG